MYPNEKPASGLHNVAEYFREQANSHEVIFHNVEMPNDPGFVVSLNQREVASSQFRIEPQLS